MHGDVTTKILKREKDIGSKSLYKLIIEVNNTIFEHHRTCNPGEIDLIADAIFCMNCKEVLLRFCPSCGSTRIKPEGNSIICYNCWNTYEGPLFGEL